MKAPILYRHRIIFLRNSGLSYRSISKKLIDENLLISHEAIRKICEKYDKTGRVTDLMRSGRRTIFNQVHYDFLEETISNNRDITNQDLIMKINLKFFIKVSNSTIIRAAEKINWHRKTTRYCQIVSEKNAIKRELYANFCLLINDQFADCIFIDESLIELEVHTLQNWQKKGCRYFKVPIAKHPLKLLLWGGISNRGATPICIFNGIMQSADFKNILKRNFLPFINNVFPDGHRLIMDNDRKHTSVETKKWLKENSINHWPTPAQSPDLNPIELVWHELKTSIRHKKPKTKTEFVDFIGKFWQHELTPEKCRSYISHVQRVIPHVILNKGKATGY